MNSDADKQAEDPAPPWLFLIQAWTQRAHLVLDAHHTAAGLFDRYHYWLGVPSVGLSALVGTAVFASLQMEPNAPAQIATGVASILAAVLASLQTFLKFNERADKHRMAGVRYGVVMRQLEQALVLPPANEEEARRFLDSIREQWDKLNSDSPTMPQCVWSRKTKEPDQSASN